MMSAWAKQQYELQESAVTRKKDPKGAAVLR
jgi:hypothetical protein